ncbi:MAG: 1-acyl-sn-glycerol-3-phosphate acyltransferase [Treponema sp.]|jgi:1-acyl-sn-glycerol-3-phosphate acyltransferase|nr:1-acyl-sn-glycerol-3-phosphate acyltransferase [Treponema sp.]
MEPYVPQLGIVYPPNPDDHMVEVKVLRNVKVDENYPFLDKSFKFRLMRGLVYLAVFTLVFCISPLRFGLKIEGRNILRKHRKLLKNGAMTISNHVQRWDFLFVLQTLRYRSMYFPVWKEQLNGSDEGVIRYAGGIPVPDELRVIKYFNRAFDEIRARKKWIHAYPESTRFDYFQPIRPFKKGVFTMAHRYNLPVIPIAISYRKPRFPYTLLNAARALAGNKKLPMITLRIGEPLLFDESLGRKEAVQKMRKECHEAVVRLAGISNNPYPAEAD